MEPNCATCEQREHCQTPCKAVNKILWENNHVMERHYPDRIEVYPQHGFEVQFSGLTDHQLDKFSNDDAVPWSSGDARLTQTAVFIERFFNKVPCRELAERFGVKENTIVCMYARAVESLKKIIEALDARREGVKAVMPGKFTDDQKFFLLVAVFGFSGAEVARMFKKDEHMVNLRVKRQADRVLVLFSGQNLSTIVEKEETPIDDPPMKDKLTRPELVNMVDSYTEQGLSHRQAFKRIADRQGEVIGRPVKMRAVESRYYKATAQEGISA